MRVETAKMSSKGQLVIPAAARQEIDVHEGTLFAVVAFGDTILLKKMERPSDEQLWKDLDRIAEEGKHRLVAKGLREKDIPGLVERRRKLTSKNKRDRVV